MIPIICSVCFFFPLSCGLREIEHGLPKPSVSIQSTNLEGAVKSAVDAKNAGKELLRLSQKYARFTEGYALINGYTDLPRQALVRAKIVRLISQGANPNVRDERGKSPLMYASYVGDTDLARDLLDHGANVNAVAKDGTTALMNVFYTHQWRQTTFTTGPIANFPLVTLLLKQGANVNAKENKYALTPIMLAVQIGDMQSIKLMIRYGADIHAHDVYGLSLDRIAMLAGQPEAAKYLREQMAH